MGTPECQAVDGPGRFGPEEGLPVGMGSIHPAGSLHPCFLRLHTGPGLPDVSQLDLHTDWMLPFWLGFPWQAVSNDGLSFNIPFLILPPLSVSPAKEI